MDDGVDAVVFKVQLALGWDGASGCHQLRLAQEESGQTHVGHQAYVE